LIAADIDSSLARFVLTGLSVTQLIFMAEVGVLILRSSLPLGLGDLMVIFALRTLIAFPLLTLAGLWFSE
jgi:nucleoside recognition membrane protein YjiH